MAGILSKAAIDQSQYDEQQQMNTICIGMDKAVAGSSRAPLLMAYDRDLIIDAIVLRANDFGTAWQITLRRADSAGAPQLGTLLMADNFVVSTPAADHTDYDLTSQLYTDTADVTDPRVVYAGQTLFLDTGSALGGPNQVSIYIRWRDYETPTS